jgi:hypothetical protein
LVDAWWTGAAGAPHSAGMKTSTLGAVIAVLAWPGVALADVAASPGAEAPRATVYEAQFFAAFAPSNALDIVRRVPGFALEETDEEVRGFSGTAGNVVLNGSRPSSKAESLQAMLAKIPARRVLRVEVASGDLYGSDYAGKSQVLNVVLSQEGGVDGNVKASIARLHDGSVFPNLEASALIRTGSSSFNLSAGTGRDKDVEVGFDDLTRTSDGARLELRDKVNDIDYYDPFFSVSWTHEGGTNKSARLNLRYAPSRFKLFQTNHVTPATGPERDDRLGQDLTTPPTNWVATSPGRWAAARSSWSHWPTAANATTSIRATTALPA